MPAQLDLDFVRAAFPALHFDARNSGGTEAAPWVLMDNAGGSVPCRPVIERAQAYLRDYGVQLGASYPRSAQAGELVSAGQAAAAQLLGTTADQVLIGPSTTMNVYVLAHAFGDLLSPGDEVVVSELDHEANIGAWRRLEQRGMKIVTWPMDVDSASLRLAELEPRLNAKTRLVCFSHCPNVVGNIHQVRAITDAVHAAGARACVDGVAYAPHRRVDVDALGADIYLASLYKVYGPHLGVAFVRSDLLDALPSQNHFFLGADAGPYRLEPGNVNHELTASLPGIVEYLESVAAHHGVGQGDGDDPLDAAFELIAAHETALAAPVLEFLRAHDKVRLLGEPSPDPELRAPTIAFCVDGTPASQVVPRVDAHRIAIRWGHFYAHRAIDRLGLLDADGVVRVSMVHYNTLAEVERLLVALDDALSA